MRAKDRILPLSAHVRDRLADFVSKHVGGRRMLAAVGVVAPHRKLAAQTGPYGNHTRFSVLVFAAGKMM
jgi:hypothetical protein